MKNVQTIVVGDIHNGFKALAQVIDRAREKWPGPTKWIFLGDYIDGWRDAVNTVDYLIELQKSEEDETVFLHGNHDYWMAQWLTFGNASINWLHNGGEATKADYLEKARSLDLQHREFFNSLDLYHIDDQNRLYIHAGYTDLRGVGYEGGLTEGCTYFWDRDIAYIAASSQARKNPFPKPDTYGEAEVQMPKLLRPYKEIYIGHTATSAWKFVGDAHTPIIGFNVVNVDTGGGWSGKLTAFNADTKEYIQSDLVYTLYPDEKGRG